MPQTLLLADDSVTIQRVIELTFADEDIRVIAVGDGQQATDRVTADPPDIVLADTGMPEQDGYEVATFIKNDPNLAHIPVVLLTGAFEPVDGDRATKSGCDAVLVKPFEPQEVIKRVRELLGKAAVSTAPVGIVGAESGYEAESDPGRGLPAGFEPRPRPVRNTALDETRATPRPVPDESTESPTSSDDGDPDPVSVYLDRVDAALDLLDNDRGAVEAPGEEAGKAMDEGLALAVPSEPAEEPPDLDSLEGRLSGGRHRSSSRSSSRLTSQFRSCWSPCLRRSPAPLPRHLRSPWLRRSMSLLPNQSRNRSRSPEPRMGTTGRCLT